MRTNRSTGKFCGLKSRVVPMISLASCRKRPHTCIVRGPSNRCRYCSRNSNTTVSELRRAWSELPLNGSGRISVAHRVGLTDRFLLPDIRQVILSQIICTAFCALAMRTSTSSNEASSWLVEACGCLVQRTKNKKLARYTMLSLFQQTMTDSSTSADWTRNRCSNTRRHRTRVRLWISDSESSLEDHEEGVVHESVNHIEYKT